MGAPHPRISNIMEADKKLQQQENNRRKERYPNSEDTIIRKNINEKMISMIITKKGRIEIITELTNQYPDRANYIIQMLNQRATKYPYLQEEIDDGEER